MARIERGPDELDVSRSSASRNDASAGRIGVLLEIRERDVAQAVVRSHVACRMTSGIRGVIEGRQQHEHSCTGRTCPCAVRAPEQGRDHLEAAAGAGSLRHECGPCSRDRPACRWRPRRSSGAARAGCAVVSPQEGVLARRGGAGGGEETGPPRALRIGGGSSLISASRDDRILLDDA